MSEDAVVAEIMKNRQSVLEDFAKAYIADTGLKPSQIELVHKHETNENEIIDTFYFKEKDDGRQI